MRKNELQNLADIFPLVKIIESRRNQQKNKKKTKGFIERTTFKKQG